MLASETATPELRRATRSTDSGWLSLVEPWTEDRPDPAHWLTTADLERARREVEEALRAGPGPIVVWGPTGHGKTLLLRSLRTRPPSGFAPLFVPFANVEPDELAGWILAMARRRPGRDPAVELARLLRADMRFGERRLLLVDEVQAMPRATLSKLFEVVTGSEVAVSVVLAGLAGDALDLALGELPRSIRKIAVSKPWSRADAEQLLTQIALTLGITPTDVIAAVDVDAALRASAGNPRLVRAALAARLRVAELPSAGVAPAAASAPPQPSSPLAASAAPDCAPPRRAMAITSSEAPAAARPQPPPRAARPEPERSPGEASPVPIPVAARAFAAISLAALVAWVAVAALVAVVTVTALVSVVTVTALISVVTVTALIAWVALVARLDRKREGIAASWRRAARASTRAAQRLRRDARLPRFPARSALAMTGAIAGLAAIAAVERAPTPAMMAVERAPTPAITAEPSREGGSAIVATIAEPIPVRVNSHPWSTVEIDGVDAGATPFTVPLEPGPHHFRVAMADGRILEKVLVVSAQQDRLAFR